MCRWRPPQIGSARCRRSRIGRSVARREIRRGRGSAAFRVCALVDPDRAGRRRQDAAGARGCARGSGRLRGRRSARAACLCGSTAGRGRGDHGRARDRPARRRVPGDAVERFLAIKHLLLVLDNCEHLPGVAPFIGELVAACPDLTVLATSREPLSVQAEQTHPVPPLRCPEARRIPRRWPRWRPSGCSASARERATRSSPRTRQRRCGRRDL